MKMIYQRVITNGNGSIKYKITNYMVVNFFNVRVIPVQLVRDFFFFPVSRSVSL